MGLCEGKGEVRDGGVTDGEMFEVGGDVGVAMMKGGGGRLVTVSSLSAVVGRGSSLSVSRLNSASNRVPPSLPC